MAKRPNPELVKYIEHHLEKGFEIRNIKRKLADVGHPIEAIEDAAQFVLSQKPQLRKRPTKFMIVYGIILIIVIAGFAYFMWFKATQQVVYQETVQKIEKNQSYLGRTDTDLIKMAASGDMAACDFIKDHNLYYACTEKYWEKKDCSYESLVGEDVDACNNDAALANNDTKYCYYIRNIGKRFDCLSLVRTGVDYQHYLVNLNQTMNTQAMEDAKKEIAFVDEAKKDASKCSGSAPHIVCIFLMVGSDEGNKMVQRYGAEYPDFSTEFSGWMYSILSAVKHGSSCSSLAYPSGIGKPVLFDIGVVKELCGSISSKDADSCQKFEDDSFGFFCSSMTKNTADECGDDYDCKLYWKLFDIV